MRLDCCWARYNPCNREKNNTLQPTALEVYTDFPQLGRFALRDMGTTIGAGVVQINLLVGTILASLLPAGAISTLYFAAGNICRSPTAEGIFRAMVEGAGLDHCVEILEIAFLELAGTLITDVDSPLAGGGLRP